MSVKEITIDELRNMKNKEGIVFQGCGDDLQEWLDGINDTFTEQGILLNGTRFEEASNFKHNGLTCLLFEFKKDMEINLGKLAVWRIRTHEVFGGTWLSDYVPIKLGGFIGYEQEGNNPEKANPDCAWIGEDGDITSADEMDEEQGECFGMEM